MQAIVINRYGGHGELTMAQRPVPAPRAGEIRARVEFAGVNYTDIYRREGHYSKSETYLTELPLVLGAEGGGTIDALGAGVSDLAIGDRVVFFVPNGAYAQSAVANIARTAKVPEGVDMHTAVALTIQGITAHYLTHSAFELKPGDTCLVHAAAGGVGQLLVQIARLKGARVLATVGTQDKADIVRKLGADVAILYRQTDFREAVMQATGGKGVDVVYDSVGKDTLAKSLRSLRPRGLCVLYGHSSGIVESIAPMALAEAGSVFLTRPHMQHYVATREEFNRRVSDLFGWLARKEVQVSIDRVLPLVQAGQAHALLEGRSTRGKVLLDCTRTAQ